MKRSIVSIVSLAIVAILAGCDGVSSVVDQVSSSDTSIGSSDDTSSLVAYIGKDQLNKLEVGMPYLIKAEVLSEESVPSNLTYLWSVINKPLGSQPKLDRVPGSLSDTTLTVDEYGVYTVALVVKGENGELGVDTITLSTNLLANDFQMQVSTVNISEVNWRTLSNVNNTKANAEVVEQGTKGTFEIDPQDPSILIYRTSELLDGEVDSARLRIWDDADEEFITVTVLKTNSLSLNVSSYSFFHRTLPVYDFTFYPMLVNNVKIAEWDGDWGLFDLVFIDTLGNEYRVNDIVSSGNGVWKTHIISNPQPDAVIQEIKIITHGNFGGLWKIGEITLNPQ